tara:strand:- start:521 stop:892 length:372 start_codon:yes stop_codon:yes gene_type:complete
MTKEPKGIGGWLLVPTIELIFSLIGFLFFGILFLLVMFEHRDFESAFFFITYFLMIGLVFYSLFLLFKKKSSFPRYAICLFWLKLLVTAGFLSIGEIFGVVVINVVMTFYLLKSKRVKNTFVN